uniref:Reverse transcriptase zinc-binding domain-containing protein n=1 Tax=Fagus sylvatica TaxID=28930 RepID=A0A2N9G5Q2_FAGSY
MFQRMECPSELREAIASIIFAAPRCSDLPDLLQIKNLFTAKYGKEFVMAVSELRPDSGVNRTIIEKLSVSAPAAGVKLKVLKDIAREYNVEWDSSSTEAEFSKKHEDLLAGSKQICAGTALSQAPTKQGSFKSSPSNGTPSIMRMDSKQESQHLHSKQEPQHLHAPSASSNATFLSTNEIEPSIKNYDVRPVSDARSETRPQSVDILEKARAAIASAERASAAARAAAALANVEFGSLKLEGQFIVKSAYQANTETSSSTNGSEIWKNLWKLKLHERLKMLLWRIGSSALPTKKMLALKMGNMDTICQLYEKAEESNVHLFFECHISKVIWFGCTPRVLELTGLELRMIEHLDALKGANIARSPELCCWKCPPSGVIKLNVDAAVARDYHFGNGCP